MVATEMRRRSAESGDSEDECSSKAERAWGGSSSSEAAGAGSVRALVRRSSAALAAAEAALARDAPPDLLRALDYVRIDTDFSTSCSSDDDVTSLASRRPACLRAGLCLAVAAFSVLVIVYVHLQ